MRTMLGCLLAVTSPVAMAVAMAAAPPYSGELIFPLEKWHNHSSSISELPNGNLRSCGFYGSGERTADDVLIQAARWNRSSGTWTGRFTMFDTPAFPETNPVLFLDA